MPDYLCSQNLLVHIISLAGLCGGDQIRQLAQARGSVYYLSSNVFSTAMLNYVVLGHQKT